MRIEQQGLKETVAWSVNFRTWLKGTLPADLVDKSAVELVRKSKRNVQNRTRKRSGKLLGAHDKALFNRTLSDKRTSSTIIIDSINTRGQSYAGYVERGAYNHLTGRMNTPVWFFRDALNELITQDLEGIKVNALSKMPKK